MKKTLLTIVVLAALLSPLHNFGMVPNAASAATLCTKSCSFVSCTPRTVCSNGACRTVCSYTPARTSVQNRITGFFKSIAIKF
ncbi:MAG: hypothetical protein ACM3PE_12825 [Deltaproteobacteria bacterium]